MKREPSLFIHKKKAMIFEGRSGSCIYMTSTIDSCPIPLPQISPGSQEKHIGGETAGYHDVGYTVAGNASLQLPGRAYGSEESVVLRVGDEHGGCTSAHRLSILSPITARTDIGSNARS